MLVDVHSSTWVNLAEWANSEIEAKHELLEMARLSHEDTQFIRRKYTAALKDNGGGTTTRRPA